MHLFLDHINTVCQYPWVFVVLESVGTMSRNVHSKVFSTVTDLTLVTQSRHWDSFVCHQLLRSLNTAWTMQFSAVPTGMRILLQLLLLFTYMTPLAFVLLLNLTIFVKTLIYHVIWSFNQSISIRFMHFNAFHTIQLPPVQGFWKLPGLLRSSWSESRRWKPTPIETLEHRICLCFSHVFTVHWSEIRPLVLGPFLVAKFFLSFGVVLAEVVRPRFLAPFGRLHLWVRFENIQFHTNWTGEQTPTSKGECRFVTFGVVSCRFISNNVRSSTRMYRYGQQKYPSPSETRVPGKWTKSPNAMIQSGFNADSPNDSMRLTIPTYFHIRILPSSHGWTFRLAGLQPPNDLVHLCLVSM